MCSAPPQGAGKSVRSTLFEVKYKYLGWYFLSNSSGIQQKKYIDIWRQLPNLRTSKLWGPPWRLAGCWVTGRGQCQQRATDGVFICDPHIVEKTCFDLFELNDRDRFEEGGSGTLPSPRVERLCPLSLLFLHIRKRKYSVVWLSHWDKAFLGGTKSQLRDIPWPVDGSAQRPQRRKWVGSITVV